MKKLNVNITEEKAVEIIKTYVGNEEEKVYLGFNFVEEYETGAIDTLH